MRLFWITITVLFLLGTLPTWWYSRTWGYLPSSILGVVLIILLIFAVSKG